MRNNNGISIIICTYNGADRLPKTLIHLIKQEFVTQLDWEIIIVNNGSEDNSSAVAESFWMQNRLAGVEFKIIEEKQKGLSFARTAGICASQFDFVIFCDDDNWLQKNYVSLAYNIISSNTKIGALGGQSTAVSSTLLPSWFENSKENYAVGSQAIKSGDITPRNFLWGSGIIIRKKLYQIAFKKYPSLLVGRRGELLSSGEDSEICIRIIMMGFKLHYSDQLKFQHFISEERLTESYNEKLKMGFYEAYNILKSYNLFLNSDEKTTSKKIFQLIKSLVKLISFKKLMESEKLNIYILTGFGEKKMDENLIKIHQIFKEISLPIL